MAFRIEIFDNGKWTDDASLLGHGCQSESNLWFLEKSAQSAIDGLVEVGFDRDRLRVVEIARPYYHPAMSVNYEPSSRLVSRESLGDWASTDVLARAALRGRVTEAELIHELLQDRQRLMEMLRESLSLRPPPPIIISRRDAA